MPSYNLGGTGNLQGYGGNGSLGSGGVSGTAAADTGLTVNQKRFYTGTMIKRMLAELIFLNGDGEKTTIPENSGGFTANSIRFMVQGSALSLATTALTEGVAPTPQTLDWREIGTRLAQYGGIATHTDLLKHVGLSGVITQIADALGEQAGRTINQLSMNVVLGGSNVLYGGGAADRGAMTVAATYKMTAALIKRAARDLRRRGVPKFPDGMYHAILSDDQVYDLQDDPAWQALNGYMFSVSTGGGSKSETPDDSAGSLFGVKIFSTPGNTVYAAGAGLNLPNTGDLAAVTVNVALGVVYGPKAFGFFDHAAWKIPTFNRMTGQGVRLYMVPADQETKDDPLGQIGVMGWKLAFGGCVLDNRRLVRLETTTTLNESSVYNYGSNSGVTGGSSNPALL